MMIMIELNSKEINDADDVDEVHDNDDNQKMYKKGEG